VDDCKASGRAPAGVLSELGQRARNEQTWPALLDRSKRHSPDRMSPTSLTSSSRQSSSRAMPVLMHRTIHRQCQRPSIKIIRFSKPCNAPYNPVTFDAESSQVGDGQAAGRGCVGAEQAGRAPLTTDHDARTVIDLGECYKCRIAQGTDRASSSRWTPPAPAGIAKCSRPGASHAHVSIPGHILLQVPDIICNQDRFTYLSTISLAAKTPKAGAATGGLERVFKHFDVCHMS
jgi:hypothetical protein